MHDSQRSVIWPSECFSHTSFQFRNAWSEQPQLCNAAKCFRTLLAREKSPAFTCHAEAQPCSDQDGLHQSLYLIAAFSNPMVGNCLAKCSTSLFSSAISEGTLVSKYALKSFSLGPDCSFSCLAISTPLGDAPHTSRSARSSASQRTHINLTAAPRPCWPTLQPSSQL